MKQMGSVIAVLLLAMVTSLAYADEHEALAAALQQVVEDNIAAYNRKDASATMRSIHTKSPAYANMESALPNQFSALNTQTELVSFRYIGHDDEFAVARVELKTTGQPEEESFVGNVMDTMTFFHQEDGVWKYWSHHVLGARIVQ